VPLLRQVSPSRAPGDVRDGRPRVAVSVGLDYGVRQIPAPSTAPVRNRGSAAAGAQEDRCGDYATACALLQVATGGPAMTTAHEISARFHRTPQSRSPRPRRSCRKGENSVNRRHVAFLTWLLAIVPLAASGEPLQPDTLVPELARGGYVLFLRHPQTNPDQADTNPLHLADIASQRQLTDEGRRQAEAIGKALRTLAIPIAGVTSSRFQRAAEAARLLGVAPVVTADDVTEGGLVVSPNENKRRAAALRKRLASAPPSGQNTLIVSHRPNLQAAAGKDLADVAEGETVVFRPRGGESFDFVARIPVAAWSEWAAQHSN